MKPGPREGETATCPRSREKRTDNDRIIIAFFSYPMECTMRTHPVRCVIANCASQMPRMGTPDVEWTDVNTAPMRLASEEPSHVCSYSNYQAYAGRISTRIF